MTWQDAVIAICQMSFVVALIPAIRAAEKPPVRTSAPTALALVSLALTFATLGLWLSVVTSVLSAMAWGVLAVQKWGKP